MSRLGSKLTALASVIVLLLQSLMPAFAQDRQLVKPNGTNDTQKRVALVIGNAAYTKTKPLANPANDASDVAAALKGLGFDVVSGVNQNKRQIETLIRDFGTKLAASGGVGLFYYAGHGIQVGGENYLVPVDADIPEEDEVAYSAVPISLVLTKMSSAKNDLNIVILDACRNNPFARSWRGFRESGNTDGLAKISPPTGTLVLYATEPGKVASDGTGRNGLFTEALLKQIRKPGLEYDQMVKALSADVWQRSGKQQLPWKEGNTLSDFYFATAGTSVVSVPEPEPKSSPINSGGIATGTIRKNSIGMELVWIPPGEFAMGSENGEADEKPVRKVTIREGFWMGKYEVTQAQWESVMGSNPSIFKDCGKECPVENVSWDDAKQFIAKLNTKGDGYVYSLPSESEWEYAARAGTNGDRYGNIDDIAWYTGNSGSSTHPVGGKLPNSFGLYDMLGNVWEWVEDIYSTDYRGLSSDGIANTTLGESGWRVLRGASENAYPDKTRTPSRFKYGPSFRFYYLGFRIVARPFVGQVPVKKETVAGEVRKSPTGIDLVWIPPGEFMMGSPDSEFIRSNDEGPQRRVTLGNGFWMGKYEVTQGQWQAVMGDNPSAFKDCGADCPVEHVSWDDVQVFLKRLNTRDMEFEYRLPSEAEWEYAARAGTTTAFAFGDSLNSTQANVMVRTPRRRVPISVRRSASEATNPTPGVSTI